MLEVDGSGVIARVANSSSSAAAAAEVDLSGRFIIPVGTIPCAVTYLNDCIPSRLRMRAD